MIVSVLGVGEQTVPAVTSTLSAPFTDIISCLASDTLFPSFYVLKQQQLTPQSHPGADLFARFLLRINTLFLILFKRWLQKCWFSFHTSRLPQVRARAGSAGAGVCVVAHSSFADGGGEDVEMKLLGT